MASDMNPQRRQEQEAVRTTIVGGRPPGCGRSTGNIPRGIEVLVKKAAVDPEFKALLLARRGEAARSIGLELSPTESMMLSAVPTAQIESIIDATTVPPTHMPAFLGKVAAVMLAALGVVQFGCDDSENARRAGNRPGDNPSDGAAAASRPAPADDPPLTIAGAVVVKPLARPATEPPGPSTQPATQPAPTQRPQNITILGLMIDRPQDTVIRGIRADAPQTVPATQPVPQPAAERSPRVTVYGAIADRPAVIKGIRVDRPDTSTAPATNPATQPATQPAQPQPPIIVAGISPAPPPERKATPQEGK